MKAEVPSSGKMSSGKKERHVEKPSKSTLNKDFPSSMEYQDILNSKVNTMKICESTSLNDEQEDISNQLASEIYQNEKLFQILGQKVNF